MKLLVAAGTRPELIKLSSLIKSAAKSEKFDMKFCYTGQHYDFLMSRSFIKELELPEPDFDLGVRDPDPAMQTSLIMSRSAKVLARFSPEYVIVQGDTNSALGVAMAAAKERISIAHVESGCRSYERTMPEEFNRVLISHAADLLMSPTNNCTRNLLAEGIPRKRIFEVGHPLVDVLDSLADKLMSAGSLEASRPKHDYFLCTLHRQENVDVAKSLVSVLQVIAQVSRHTKVVLPMHPRTRKRVREFGLEGLVEKVDVIDPVGYVEMLSLIKNAKLVLTDSGGIQQEASILGTYCVTLRKVTEWVETVRAGANYLAGVSKPGVLRAIRIAEKKSETGSAPNVFKRRGATGRILDLLTQSRKL
ncbi:MAG: UDP-N-acetylglucosamine 2-epimerase (non-hydrolyzing) [Nitrososphaerota archaeon]|nr:UDP-N-acetylglucosamine 2-epimerase (non-hydrolyzing) [Nitrososphaerota archaeon]